MSRTWQLILECDRCHMTVTVPARWEGSDLTYSEGMKYVAPDWDEHLQKDVCPQCEEDYQRLLAAQATVRQDFMSSL